MQSWLKMPKRALSISEYSLLEILLGFSFFFLIRGKFPGGYYDIIYIKPHTQNNH